MVIKTYDAIIVGARCAGAPTALLLSQKGYRVLLVDRASFPSDTISTHYIQPDGVSRLAKWGLLKRIKKSQCPPIRKVSLFSGPKFLRALFMDLGPRGVAYCPRRILLDSILVKAAADAGAEVRERFRFLDVIWRNGTACGIRGHTGLRVVSEAAKIVIGADGVCSSVAKAVRAPVTRIHPMNTNYIYSYWDSDRIRDAEIYFGHRRAVTAFPTNEKKVCVAAVWSTHEASELKLGRDIPGNYVKTLQLFSRLYDQVKTNTREKIIFKAARHSNFIRKAYGPGWALVGDAGCHKDPLTAFGISDAFRDAEFLAGAIDEVLRGKGSFDKCLTRFEKKRNQAETPLFNFTLEVARAMEKFAGP